MAIPTSGQLGGTPTNTQFQGYIELLRDVVSNAVGGAGRYELTIASGAVTPPARDHGGVFKIDTEGNAASDTLDTITLTNVPDGSIFIVMAEDAARVVTLNHAAGGSGQMMLTDSTDFVFSALGEWIAFQRRSTDCVELTRGYGSSYYAQHDFLRIASVPAHNTLCPHARLVIDYATASTVTVAADAVVLSDSSGRLKRFNTLSETLNIANTGANGRDIVDNAGAEQASSWYHIFAIGQDGGTVDVFASQVGYPGSATSIYTRLPSGYTWAGYLGAVYNNASSNLDEIYQRGDVVAGYNQSAALSAGANSNFTAVSLTAFIPITARGVKINAIAVNTISQTSAQAVIASDGTTTTIKGDFMSASFVGTAYNGINTRVHGELVLTTAQQVKYYASSNCTATFYVAGWRY